jgi:hypothetical protein
MEVCASAKLLFLDVGALSGKPPHSLRQSASAKGYAGVLVMLVCPCADWMAGWVRGLRIGRLDMGWLWREGNQGKVRSVSSMEVEGIFALMARH